MTANAAKKEYVPIPEGTYEGIVEFVGAKDYNTGAFGIEVRYSLQNAGEFTGSAAYDRVTLIKKDKSKNDVGEEIWRKRLDAFGLTSKDLSTFQTPKTSEEYGDLGKLKGATVRIEIKHRGTWEGKPNVQVNRVFFRDAETDAAA